MSPQPGNGAPPNAGIKITVSIEDLLKLISVQARAVVPHQWGISIVLFGPESTEGEQAVRHMAFGNPRDAIAACRKTIELIERKIREPQLILPHSPLS